MARFLWTQKEDIGPSPRVGHAMSFDPIRGRTILFGGNDLDGNLLADTWGWDGQFWTQLADFGPQARHETGLCFDAARGVALLFGGNGRLGLLRDSWTWNGEEWTQVEDSGPSARRGHALTFDPSRGRAVLFGGENDAPQSLNDTWEWDGTAWTQIDDVGPSARRSHMMAFDPASQRTVLFGGDAGDGTALGDTWQWDGNHWTQVEDIGPGPCLRSALVATDAQLILFGGLNGLNGNPPVLFDDSWAYRGGSWTQRQDMGPAARWGHAMAFDTTSRTALMFGGHTSVTFDEASDLLADTWAHVETEQPVGGGGGDAALVQLTLAPSTVTVGEMVVADVMLTGPAPSDLPIQIWGVGRSIYQAANGDLNLIQQSEFFQLGEVFVPAGFANGNTSFATPGIGDSIVVIAVGPSGFALADLTVN